MPKLSSKDLDKLINDAYEGFRQPKQPQVQGGLRFNIGKLRTGIDKAGRPRVPKTLPRVRL